MKLKDIVFSDIYLGEGASWLAGVPHKLDPVPAPEECLGELGQLREQCIQLSENTQREEFAVRGDGISLRASILESLTERVYVLRRIPPLVPDLDGLGLHKQYISHFMTPKLSGLIVISGTFGQGKTWTASSMVAARLKVFGGVAVTAEDPPEMPLQGRHGEGVCYQTWVDQGGFGQACRKAARWAPSIIFLGEIRDSESAAEALRASINGRLVVCTTHADSVSMTVERLYSLANGSAGTSEDVASLLASGLRVVAHQQLITDAQGAKRPKMKFLWLSDDDAATAGVRSSIRQRRFTQVEEEVQRQLNRLMVQRTA